MENWRNDFRLDGVERISGAWLGLFEADLISTGVNPETPITEDMLSAQALQALTIIESLSQSHRFDLFQLQITLDNIPQPKSPEKPFNDQGLFQALALTLWIRTKKTSHFCLAIKEFLSLTDTPEVSHPMILALCSIVRKSCRARKAMGTWQLNFEQWKTSMQNDLGDFADYLPNLNHKAYELRWETAFSMLQVSDDFCAQKSEHQSFELQHLGASLNTTTGFIAGLNKGINVLSQQWNVALMKVPRIAESLDMLKKRFRDYPCLTENINITSDNMPLAMVGVPCRKGILCLTAAPGATNVRIVTEYGSRNVVRNMEDDIARIQSSEASFLVCLISNDEIVQQEMTSLGLACEAIGFEWASLPSCEQYESKDSFVQEVADLSPRLISILDNGGTVAVCGSDCWSWTESSFVILLSSLELDASQESINQNLDEAVQLGMVQFNDTMLI